MTKPPNNHSGAFAGLIVGGTLVSAVSLDLTGRLLQFLYGEWPYVCIGLVVVAFVCVTIWAHSDLSRANWAFQQDIESKLNQYAAKISASANSVSYIEDELEREIEFLKENLLENRRQAYDMLKKAEKLLEQKLPVIVEVPSPAVVEPIATAAPVQEAVAELVGGA